MTKAVYELFLSQVPIAYPFLTKIGVNKGKKTAKVNGEECKGSWVRCPYIYTCCSELDDRVVNICFIWCRDAVDDILAGPSDLWMYYAANI